MVYYLCNIRKLFFMDQWILGLINQYDGYGMALFILITTVCSGLLSCLFGIERELIGKSAGLRTHVLVSVGCSLLMTISIYAIKATGIDVSYDASRIAAGVVSGIGFLCAGAIIKIGLSVKGLTTAATLWICSTIGLACGAGFVLEAIVGAAVSFFFLMALLKVERFIDNKSPRVKIISSSNASITNLIHEVAESNAINIKKIDSDTIKDDQENDVLDITIWFDYHTPNNKLKNFVDIIKKKDGVKLVQYSKYQDKKY